MKKTLIDLHMHSFFSGDGEFSPADLVRKCKGAGISVMSVTDHNSVRGNAEARKEAEAAGIKYISGIEIDCMFQGKNLHLLGYGIDESSPDFERLEERNLSSEKNASMERLLLTRRLGFELSEAELDAIPTNIGDGTGIWIGETFAEVLLGKEEYMDHKLLLPYRAGGAWSDNPFVNFYWDYYSQGKPCYVKIDYPDIRDAIALIKNNGGWAVLAHPGHTLKEESELFGEIAKTGIDGAEVFCSYHDEKIAKYFYEQAKIHSLMTTCGSDYHGKIKPAVRLGETGCWIDGEQLMRELGLT